MEDKQESNYDNFRENLHLGITSALAKLPGVQDIQFHEQDPGDQIAITSWEQRYSTILPQEIKDFYLATDGFKITWNYCYAGQVLPIGQMIINKIGDLKRIAGLRHRFDSEQPTLLDLEIVNNQDKSSRVVHAPPSMTSSSSSASTSLIKPQFGLRWKMFEIDNCNGNGRVCLVFPPKPDPDPIDDRGMIHIDVVPVTPQIWYLDRAYDWHFLAPNFSTYLRMMLVHLGLPQWQALFTPYGPTPWAKHLINLIAPHLLETENEPVGTQDSQEEIPICTLDPSIFKIGRKIPKKGENDQH